VQEGTTVKYVAGNNKSHAEMKDKLSIRHASTPFKSLAITKYTKFCEVSLSKTTKSAPEAILKMPTCL